MGISKTAYFSDSQNKIAGIAKALGHPARVAILEHLIKVDACICGELVEELPLAQPTISQHLKELKNVNLIKGNIEGSSICYCINKDTLLLLKNFLSHLGSDTSQNNFKNEVVSARKC